MGTVVNADGRGKAKPAAPPVLSTPVPIAGGDPRGLLPVPVASAARDAASSSFVSSAIVVSISSGGANLVSLSSACSCLKRISDDVVDSVSLSNNSGRGDASKPRVLRVRTILTIKSTPLYGAEEACELWFLKLNPNLILCAESGLFSRTKLFVLLVLLGCLSCYCTLEK